jgi:hypothetical protein
MSAPAAAGTTSEQPSDRAGEVDGPGDTAEEDWTSEFLAAYRAHRLDDQTAFYKRRATEFEAARREALWLAAAFLVLAALFGALATADHVRRQVWAVLATIAGSLATAVGTYEAAFGFDRLARQYEETRAALHLADIEGPTTSGPEPPRRELVIAYVEGIEDILRSEVDSWSRLTQSIETEMPGRVDAEASSDGGGRPPSTGQTAPRQSDTAPARQPPVPPTA